MKLVYFAHSLRSCWNHGNAHFVRGVLRELSTLGVEVVGLEPETGWSLANLLADQGAGGLAAFSTAYPDLRAETWSSLEAAVERAFDADVVLVHEWNDKALAAALSAAARSRPSPLLLFHDTHHRAVSDPAAMRDYDLTGFDGVLAFGEALADVYRRDGWGRRAFVWHEAADHRLFRPPEVEGDREGVVFVGNFGDEERTAELETYLLGPTRDVGAALDVFGVRYPDEGVELLHRYGAEYRGWLANPRAPAVFARHAATVHVPRRFYASRLPGIPTIRVFEALACGIPLLSAPWRDCEGLFRPETDYITAASRPQMAKALRTVLVDRDMAGGLARAGRQRILERHTCAHRAAQLLEILDGLRPAPARRALAETST